MNFISDDAVLTVEKMVFLVLGQSAATRLPEDFCGTRIQVKEPGGQVLPDLSHKTVYLCGDISMAANLDLTTCARVLVVREHSFGFTEADPPWPIIAVGCVPRRIHGLGVLYCRYFDPEQDYFQRITQEHAFQALTESTKPATAHRTGIYLTPVTRDAAGLHFNLLRCSTNLSGPTENFRANDRHIVNAVNGEAAFLFDNHAPLNHVLAQVYRNTPATDETKQTKAKIRAHADKTKDMPANGIMAFCTFYDQLERLQPLAKDPFDWGYKNTSGLTDLVFRLKPAARESFGDRYPAQFTVKLYPGSVFLMPLSTNRWYTHEIKPSTLDAERLPTRLGYVVRCAATEAVHQDGQTLLKYEGARVPLEPRTTEGMAELRKRYAAENKSTDPILYGRDFNFSMNEGDYRAPAYRLADEFPCYPLPDRDDLFETLAASVDFETVGKGREGMVLVRNDARRGTPLVRTTSKYQQPAQVFRAEHVALAELIRHAASLPTAFNNALVERYHDTYARMGFHSDQAQDLAADSYIALYSCYQSPSLKPSRKLVVAEKGSGGETFEIPLVHNGVVVFSTAVNRRFKHKIVLVDGLRQSENPWLGFTFRTTNTFIRYGGEGAFFADGTPLTMADEATQRAFYKLRSRENKETNFTYPPLATTLSESDLMAPVTKA